MLHSSFHFLSTTVAMHIDLKNGSDCAVVLLLTGIAGLLLSVILSTFNFLKSKRRPKIKLKSSSAIKKNKKSFRIENVQLMNKKFKGKTNKERSVKRMKLGSVTNLTHLLC